MDCIRRVLLFRNLGFLLAISGVLLLGAHHPVSANNDAKHKASAAIKAKDFKSALTHLEPLANDGDIKAQLQIGLILRRGLGDVTKDEARAFNYFLGAAGQKQWNSQYIVAEMYAEGSGVTQDDVAALKWAGIAAGRGSKTGLALANKLRTRMSEDDIRRAQVDIDAWSKATLIDGRTAYADGENRYNGLVAILKSKPDC